MKQLIKSSPNTNKKLPVGIVFSGRLLGENKYTIVGTILMGISPIIYFIVAPVYRLWILFPIAALLFFGGAFLFYFFTFRNGKLELNLTENGQTLTFSKRGFQETFQVVSYRFRWSYTLGTITIPDQPDAQPFANTNNVILNLELLTADKEHILIIQNQSTFSHHPKGWKYFAERDALQAKPYPVKRCYHISSGLKKLKEEFERATDHRKA